MNPLLRWVNLTMVAGAMAVAGCDASDPPPREVPLADIESEISEVLCGPMFECGCPPDSTFYDSASTCRDVTKTLADQVRQVASLENLTWDPSCLGATLDIIDDAGCGAAFDLPDDDETCRRPCHYLYGSKAEGSECSWVGDRASECAQGLECAGGVCLDPCGDGTPGLAGEGDPCLSNTCGSGLTCDWENDRCVKLPQAGSPCPLGACVEGAFCELEDPNDPMTQMVCKSPYAFGEACRGHSQCETGYCPAGFCDELPGEGESCMGTGVCAPGFDCIEDACQPGAPAVCSVPIPLPGL
jgi:hypothetical protein